METINIELKALVDCDKSIVEEIVKNLQCDIEDLIEKHYKDYINEVEIDGRIKGKIRDFQVGDTVRVKKFIGTDFTAIEIGDIGVIYDIDYIYQYPIECEFDNDILCSFHSEELELVEE